MVEIPEMNGEEWAAVSFLAERTARPGAAKRLLELLALEGPLSPSEAAKRLGVQRPVISMIVKELELAEAIARPDIAHRGHPRVLELFAGSPSATAEHVRRRIAERFGLRLPESVTVRLPRMVWEAVIAAATTKGVKPETLAARMILQRLAVENKLPKTLEPDNASSVVRTPVQMELEDAIANTL